MSIKAIEDAHGPEAAHRVRAEAHRQHADLGILPYFNRAVAAHRDATLKRTHVIVGDHPPEPRANHEMPMPWCNYCQCYHHSTARCIETARCLDVLARARGSLDDMR